MHTARMSHSSILYELKLTIYSQQEIDSDFMFLSFSHVYFPWNFFLFHQLTSLLPLPILETMAQRQMSKKRQVELWQCRYL